MRAKSDPSYSVSPSHSHSVSHSVLPHSVSHSVFQLQQGFNINIFEHSIGVN